MKSLIDNDDEFVRGERELTLSTGAILGIFLGLVLLCGLFFGFGYKMGSRKPPVPAEDDASTTTAPPPAPATDFNSFKPSAGSPASSPAGRSATAAPSADAGSSALSASTAYSARSTSQPAPRGAPAPIVRSTPPSAAALAASLAAGPVANATGNFVVQVAAVSLQEDADLLAGALRSKGYAVTERAQPDRLIHIQVGPFSNRKEAEAMRQRLLGDGYNALVK